MTTFKSNTGRLARRYLKTAAVTGGLLHAMDGYLEACSMRWGSDTVAIKSTVAALSSGAFGTADLPPGTDFLELLRPQTIVGRLPALRRVPFRTRLVMTSGGTTAYWVNEGDPKPVSAITLSDAGLLLGKKVIGLSVVTEESVRAADADDIVSRDLIAATVVALDQAFIQPQNAGDDATPQSVTYGAPTVAGSGDPIADLKALIAAYQGRLDTAAFVLSPETAVALALRGAPFDRLGALGGTLLGLAAITSRAVSQDSSGGYIALIDMDSIEIGLSPGANLTVSTDASVLMESAPGTGAASLVSLFQTNSVGLLAEVQANWRTRGAAETAAVLTGLDY